MINPRPYRVHEDLAKIGIVKYPLEDGLIVVHPAHDRPHEHPVEHKSEVLDGVVLGLGLTSGSATQVSSN